MKTSTAEAPAVGDRSHRKALVVSGVSRSFRGVRALTGVDLTLWPGEILGLVGPNGAGKSTLVNIISGYDRPDEGSVAVAGAEVTERRARQRVLGGVARTFQHGHLFSGLSVRENVEVAALATGASRREARIVAANTLELLGLVQWADHEARALPHGVERRVGVARALAGRPSYLLLDEPAAGLNEGEIESFETSIREIAHRGTGVLLIDHNIRLIFRISDRINVIVNGENFLEGTPDEVRNDEALAHAYLGKSGTRDAQRDVDASPRSGAS